MRRCNPAPAVADKDIVNTPSKMDKCPLKRDHFNGKYTFQPLIFSGHVSFPGSTQYMQNMDYSHVVQSISLVRRPHNGQGPGPILSLGSLVKIILTKQGPKINFVNNIVAKNINQRNFACFTKIHVGLDSLGHEILQNLRWALRNTELIRSWPSSASAWQATRQNMTDSFATENRGIHCMHHLHFHVKTSGFAAKAARNRRETYSCNMVYSSHSRFFSSGSHLNSVFGRIFMLITIPTIITTNPILLGLPSGKISVVVKQEFPLSWTI